MTVTYSKLQYIPRTNELVEDPREVVYAICPACEYVSYNIPRREDDAHDELCCGAVPCSQPPNEPAARTETTSAEPENRPLDRPPEPLPGLDIFHVE